VGRAFYRVLIALMTITPVVASAETVRCSHEFPPQHYATRLIERWAADIERLSKGRLTVDLIGNSNLFQPDENIRAVARGDIECAFSLNFQWSRTLPLMTVTLAPFMTASPNIPRRWASSEAVDILESAMRDKGVQSVAWLFLTNRSVITSKGHHILRPEDFGGLRMRGRVPVLDRTLQSLGTLTLPMDSSQLYEAMRTDVIDSAMTDVAVAATARLYEQHDHMVILPLVSVYANAYVASQWYDRLDDDLKQAFQQAGENLAQLSVTQSMAASSAAEVLLRERGVDVHVASDEEIEVLRAALQPVFLELFLKETGEEGRQLIELIRDLE
jgi:TRAP-type C4-dicarboxylate transport system substrate-binding protein